MHHSKRNVYKTLVSVWAEFTPGPWLLLTIGAPSYGSIHRYLRPIGFAPFWFDRNRDIAGSTAIRLQELRKSDE
jgi:hypothetical protein